MRPRRRSGRSNPATGVDCFTRSSRKHLPTRRGHRRGHADRCALAGSDRRRSVRAFGASSQWPSRRGSSVQSAESEARRVLAVQALSAVAGLDRSSRMPSSRRLVAVGTDRCQTQDSRLGAGPRPSVQAINERGSARMARPATSLGRARSTSSCGQSAGVWPIARSTKWTSTSHQR